MRVQCITDLICNFAKLIHGYIALINIARELLFYFLFCFIFKCMDYIPPLQFKLQKRCRFFIDGIFTNHNIYYI